MSIENLKFTKTHEWLDDTVADNMILGITEHAQSLLGDIVFVELPAIGKKINAGEAIGVLESVKAAADFYSPIDGIIVAVNEELKSRPELINTEPYAAGWLVKIKAHNVDMTNSLLSFSEYNTSINEG